MSIFGYIAALIALLVVGQPALGKNQDRAAEKRLSAELHSHRHEFPAGTSDDQLIRQYQDLFGAPPASPDRQTMRVDAGMKCGTPIALEIKRRWSRLSDENKRALIESGYGGQNQFRNSRTAQLYDEKTYSSGPFLFHYWTEGYWAVNTLDSSPKNGVPDYIDQMAQIFLEVWAAEIDGLEWGQPPNDEDNQYDIYADYLPSGILGRAYWGDTIGDNPYTDAEEAGAAPGFIIMRNEYSDDPDPSGLMKTTAAHEFHHLIQYGYNTYEADWLYEATADWIVDEVYDEVNHNVLLGHLYGLFYLPDESLNSTYNAHTYAMWIYLRYASERLGKNIVRSVWENSVAITREESEVDRSLEAVAAAFEAAGTDLRDLTIDFSIANLVMASPPDHPPFQYEEASLYPDLWIEGTLAAGEEETIHYSQIDGNAILGFYGADYLRITGEGKIQIDFNGVGAGNGLSLFTLSLKDNAYTLTERTLNASNDATVIFQSMPDELHLIVMNLGDESDDPQYSVTIEKLPEIPVILSSPCELGDVGSAYRYDCSPYGSAASSLGPSTDMDGGTVAVTWTAPTAPAGFSINATTAAVQWTPVSPGSFAVSLVASTESGSSTPQSFTVSVDPADAPPEPLTDLSVSVSSNSATLEFSPPQDPDLAGCAIVRSETGVPADVNDGTLIHDGDCDAGTVVDSGLLQGTVYHYAAFTRDASSNYSTEPSHLCAAPGMERFALDEGWNLVAMPLTPTKNDLNLVFGKACGASSFGDGLYVLPEQITSVPISGGRGLWICMKEASETDMSGAFSLLQSFSLPLEKKWNLIGNPFGFPLPWDDAHVEIGPAGMESPLSTAVNVGWTDGKLYRFDPVGETYSELADGEKTLDAWKGYFLEINENCSNCYLKLLPPDCASN